MIAKGKYSNYFADVSDELQASFYGCLYVSTYSLQKFSACRWTEMLNTAREHFIHIICDTKYLDNLTNLLDQSSNQKSRFMIMSFNSNMLREFLARFSTRVEQREDTQQP